MTARPAGAAEAGRPRLLTRLLLLPAGTWYLFLLVVPLVITLVFSFGARAATGGYEPAFRLDNYARILDRVPPIVATVQMAVSGTVLCLLLALPLAYFLATRAGRWKSVLIILIVVPFWTSFLIRTYAWRTILGSDGIAGIVANALGLEDFTILGTGWAITIGLVYNYLPLMLFPIYVSLERLDRAYLEASKDLYAGRWATFRQVTLPLAAPGIITGVLLVFIPMMGEYVIPAMLGRGQVFLIGNVLYLEFLEQRNWPQGSAMAVALILVMLVAVAFYLRLTSRGPTGRGQSVL
jgi:spermidine/putrescine transport system permease protein